MEAHGGDIVFQNNLVRGASFILTFPISASKVGEDLPELSLHSKRFPVLLSGMHDGGRTESVGRAFFQLAAG